MTISSNNRTPLPEMESPAAPAVVSEATIDTAVRGVEALNILVHERNMLRDRLAHIENTSNLAIAENAQLRKQINALTLERDHYMRHAVELVTVLGNTQSIINEAVKEARVRAYAPAGKQKQQGPAVHYFSDPHDPIPNFLTKGQ